MNERAERNPVAALMRKYFETDLSRATRNLETMGEEDVVDVLKALPAFLAASVVALFEGIIAKITVLAVFLPVVAGQGGNAGLQSLAIVMRGLVMREIPKNLI